MGQANGLEWAPIGATWTYLGPGFGNDRNPFTLTSLKDTLIEGNMCRYIATPRQSVEIILYEQNDTVFTYRDNEFRILYDFTAQPGDTVAVYAPGEGCPEDTYLIRIDSVGTVPWEGISLRVQWFSNVNRRDCNASYGSSEIVEIIGDLVYLIPQSIIASPVTSAGLLLYSDSTCHQIFLDSSRTECFPNGGFSVTACAYQATCDTTINVSTDGKIFDSQVIQVYPSPAQDHIILQSTSGQFLFGKVAMYDLTGKIATCIKHDKARETIIDVSHLRNGIYYLQVEIDGKLYREKIYISK